MSLVPGRARTARARRRGAALWLVWLAALGLAAPAQAHKLAPSLLAIDEERAEHFSVLWRSPQLVPRGPRAEVRLPDNCQALSTPQTRLRGSGVDRSWRVRCAGGLVGRSVQALNLSTTQNAALLDIRLADGRRFSQLLSAGDNAFTVPERQSWASVLISYVGLGAKHLASGWDHLLFLLALVLLVRTAKTLLWTITAFTIGHSITLSLATLDLIRWTQTLSEAAIALSVYLLAVELLARKPRLARRIAWVACAFGLLHGMGFASALREIGLPADTVALSLFGFNVGVELGQIAFALPVAFVCHWGRQRLSSASRAGLLTASAYLIGSMGSFWLIERLLASA